MKSCLQILRSDWSLQTNPALLLVRNSLDDDHDDNVKATCEQINQWKAACQTRHNCPPLLYTSVFPSIPLYVHFVNVMYTSVISYYYTVLVYFCISLALRCVLYVLSPALEILLSLCKVVQLLVSAGCCMAFKCFALNCVVLHWIVGLHCVVLYLVDLMAGPRDHRGQISSNPLNAPESWHRPHCCAILQLFLTRLYFACDAVLMGTAEWGGDDRTHLMDQYAPNYTPWPPDNRPPLHSHPLCTSIPLNLTFIFHKISAKKFCSHKFLTLKSVHWL